MAVTFVSKEWNGMEWCDEDAMRWDGMGWDVSTSERE